MFRGPQIAERILNPVLRPKTSEKRAKQPMGRPWKWRLAICCVLGHAAQAGDRLDALPEAPDVLLPGSYHADEVKAVAGPGWLALLVLPTSALVPGDLTITTEYDAVLDQDGGPFTGKHVSFASSPGAVVLLKGRMFVAGPLAAASVTGEYAGLSPKIIMFNEQRYVLQLDQDCVDGASHCEWILSDGRRRQVIGRLGGWVQNGAFVTEGSNTGLLWAGDLDRDGRLDLVIDVSDHYNAVAQVRLLLSSGASDEALLGEVASFSAVGC